jgi:hypothetical protein
MDKTSAIMTTEEILAMERTGRRSLLMAVLAAFIADIISAIGIKARIKAPSLSLNLASLLRETSSAAQIPIRARVRTWEVMAAINKFRFVPMSKKKGKATIAMFIPQKKIANKSKPNTVCSGGI